MHSLDSDFRLKKDPVDSLLEQFKLAQHEEVDRKTVRDKVKSSGHVINSIRPQTKPLRILTADCSNAVRELRYTVLWAAHAVAVYAEFDGEKHPDELVGHSSIPYGNLMQSNYVGMGEIIPYEDVDLRANCARVKFEFSSLNKASAELASEGVSQDLTIVDGSLYTNYKNLSENPGQYPEYSGAASEFKKLMGSGKVVGLVEDSHATDISRRLGFNFTNLLLFEIALDPCEYVSQSRDGVNICYLKLPGKKLPHDPLPVSPPLTVRWEFNYPDFEDDLRNLVGIWLLEDDLLHPQLYPVRIADYLTRRIRVSGIIEKVIDEQGLELKYRELRQG